MINWNNNDTKYIIKRLILYLIITGIVFFAGAKCAKASVVSRYMCNESGGNNGCDYTMPSTSTSSELPLYYMGDNRPFFANAGQGYINFSFIAWGYSGSYNLPIYSVEITSDLNASTGNQSLFACDIGTYSQYHDNQNNYVVYSVKCPVSIGSLGLHGIRVHKYSGDETLLIKRGSIITFTSELDISNSINSSTQNIANQQMQNDNANANAIMSEINRDMYGVQSRLDNYGTQAHQDAQNIVNGLQQATSTEQATQDYLKEDYQFDQQMIADFNVFGSNTNYLQQILMWPYNLALSLGTALSGTTCSIYSFGYLYGTELKLPCINWKQYVGNTIYVAIDTIMGMCILFGVITFIRKAFEYVLNFGNDAYETISVEVFK